VALPRTPWRGGQWAAPAAFVSRCRDRFRELRPARWGVGPASPSLGFARGMSVRKHPPRQRWRRHRQLVSRSAQWARPPLALRRSLAAVRAAHPNLRQQVAARTHHRPQTPFRRLEVVSDHPSERDSRLKEGNNKPVLKKYSTWELNLTMHDFPPSRTAVMTPTPRSFQKPTR
jgi:hypothetical protein